MLPIVTLPIRAISMSIIVYLPLSSNIVLCIFYSNVLFNKIAVPLAAVEFPDITISIFQSSLMSM